MLGFHRIGNTLAAAALSAGLCLAVMGCGANGTSTAGVTTASTTPSTSTESAPLKAKRTYEREMQRLGGKLGATLRVAGTIELAAQGKGAAGAKDANALENARVALRSAAVQLARIEPPPDVRSAHALLVSGVNEYADELGAVIDKLHAGGAPVTVLQRIFKFKGVKDMERASIQIEKKGYDIVRA